VVRLIIAIAIGAVIAAGGMFALQAALTSAANGTPSQSNLYQYGNR
jgi:hypothetical protein